MGDSSDTGNGDFRTKDLALATFLNLQDFCHSGLEVDTRKGKKRMVWIFKRSAELDAAVVDYESGNASVNPKKFMVALSTIRVELYHALDAEGLSR